MMAMLMFYTLTIFLCVDNIFTVFLSRMLWQYFTVCYRVHDSFTVCFMCVVIYMYIYIYVLLYLITTRTIILYLLIFILIVLLIPSNNFHHHAQLSCSPLILLTSLTVFKHRRDVVWMYIYAYDMSVMNELLSYCVCAVFFLSNCFPI